MNDLFLQWAVDVSSVVEHGAAAVVSYLQVTGQDILRQNKGKNFLFR